MPIAVSCPECNANYRVADEAAGKAVKCKKCGARVPVPAASAEDDENDLGAITSQPSSRAARKDDDGDDGDEAGGGAKVKKAKSNKTLYIILGVVAAFTCCCFAPVGTGGLLWYFDVFSGVKQGVVVKEGKDIFKDKLKDIAKDLGKDMAKGGPVGPVVVANLPFEKKDTLMASDPLFNFKPAKAFKVRLEAGKDYVIDMTTPNPQVIAMDPLLIMVDAKNMIVAQDDDGGGNFNARINFRPMVTAEYTIQATSVGPVPPAGLPFNLSIKSKK